MYTTIIPVGNRTLRRSGREKTVAVLRNIKASRILLAIGAFNRDKERWRETIAELEDNMKYMKSEGFEVSVWLWALACHNPGDFTRLTGFNLKQSQNQCCPLDENFLDFAASCIREIAQLNPTMILFDDDLRFGHHDIGLGCCCELHLCDIESRLGGEELPKDKLTELFFCGEPNKYRSAYLDSMGDSIRNFARRMREAVDSVNPEIRLGTCACITTWDIDGVDSVEVAKILAGNTKPYLRLIGAPYWAAKHNWGNRLQDVIELNRMELTWCAPYADIEIVTEGDVYPRPRYACKAAYLENFDIAMRADSRANGIMKYMLDYTASQDYETGYIQRHINNQSLYTQVERYFAGKTATGVRVYEEQRKIRNYSLPEQFVGIDMIQDMLFSKAARMLAGCSIPTAYHASGVAGIAFGENAKYLPKQAFESGLILDMASAKILMGAGHDVGILHIGERIYPSEEHYLAESEHIHCSDVTAHRLELAEGATVQSRFVCSDGKEYPAAFTYENSEGHRFLVFAFDMLFTGETIYRNYMRQKQLVRCIEWLQRKKLPCICTGNPDLYIMCKKNGSGEYAVGLWNLSEDYIETPTIEMNGKIINANFINCLGEINESKIVLETVQPFAFAGFTARVIED